MMMGADEARREPQCTEREAMTFEEVLDQAMAMLQRRGRRPIAPSSCTSSSMTRTWRPSRTSSFTANAWRWMRTAVSWCGRVGRGATGPVPRAPVAPPPPDAERRQLTVLFCDLVDSTLAGQLDPEDYRQVVRTYQTTAAQVIQRFDGHIAQYLGDGLLVYFGYPQAHEDDAQRAVHGTGTIEAIEALHPPLERDTGVRLAVRVGMHTGLVVVGEVGGGQRQEQPALGDTPNLAARLQSLAAPNTVVISAATQRLVEGYFTCIDLGTHTLKGVATPQSVRRVVRASGRRPGWRLPPPWPQPPGRTGLRSHAAAGRWAQVKEGLGQVVLLHGEAGIGKSRLTQVLKEYVASDAHSRIECRSSPYYQHTAWYPITDLCERLAVGA